MRVFLNADIFLMCQTRSPKVVEDPEVFALLTTMAERKKVGVSFSITTDIRDEQRKIERGGLRPELRLRAMRTLKNAGIFVSAAVSPLMPYSTEFARRLLKCANHASIQLLRPLGFGSTTPKDVLSEVYETIPGYRQLDVELVDQLKHLDTTTQFSWGVGNKGFMGAFLAANRFYGLPASREYSARLALADRESDQVEVAI